MTIPFMSSNVPKTKVMLLHNLSDGRPPKTVDLDHVLFCIHFTAGSPNDGLFTAQNSADGDGAEWERTCGITTGQIYEHTKPWSQGGWNLSLSHDTDMNAKAVGMEHTGTTDTKWLNFPLGLNASAREVALLGVAKKRRPKRGKVAGNGCAGTALPEGWIYGHGDDQCYGGGSSHTDPYPNWPWDDYIDLCGRWYDYLLGGEEEPMNPIHEAYLDALLLDKTAEEASKLGNRNRGTDDGGTSANRGDPEDATKGPYFKGWYRTVAEAKKNP